MSTMGNMTTSALRNPQTSFDLDKTFPPEVIMLKILTWILWKCLLRVTQVYSKITFRSTVVVEISHSWVTHPGLKCCHSKTVVVHVLNSSTWEERRGWGSQFQGPVHTFLSRRS